MIAPLLSATYRTLGIYNASAKAIILSITSINSHRDIHLKHIVGPPSQHPQKRLSAYTRKSFDKIAGLPSKPKQPIPPYIRFMLQVRPLVKAEHPHLQVRDMYTIITERWKLLDDKEKEILSKEYRNDLLKYSEEIANYNRTLTDDDKQLIEQKLADINGRSLMIACTKRARELNKPKKPANSFLRFLHAQTDRQPDERYKVYMKRIGLRWQELSEMKKKKYKTTPEEMENYKKAMLVWEATIVNLIETGGDDDAKFPSKLDEQQYDEEFVESDESDDEEL